MYAGVEAERCFDIQMVRGTNHNSRDFAAAGCQTVIWSQERENDIYSLHEMKTC